MGSVFSDDKKKNQVVVSDDKPKYLKTEGLESGFRESVQLYNQHLEYFYKRKKYIQKQLEKIPNHPSTQPTITGWKIVRIMSNGELDMEAIAILEMQITGDIKNPQGKKMIASDLKTTEKYCTDECRVVGVQFVGQFTPGIYDLLKNFMNSQKVKLVSNFDSAFEYKLGHIVRERECGEPGVGCAQGMYFFIDKLSCFKYLYGGFAGIPLSWPTIVPSVESSDIELKDMKVANEIPAKLLTENIIDALRERIAGVYGRIDMTKGFKGMPKMPRVIPPVQQPGQQLGRQLGQQPGQQPEQKSRTVIRPIQQSQQAQQPGQQSQQSQQPGQQAQQPKQPEQEIKSEFSWSGTKAAGFSLFNDGEFPTEYSNMVEVVDESELLIQENTEISRANTDSIFEIIDESQPLIGNNQPNK